MSTCYERWAELPVGTKFHTPYEPGKVFMKTARFKGMGVICLTDGRPNRISNIINPLAGFEHAVRVIDFKALADDAGAAADILRCL